MTAPARIPFWLPIVAPTLSNAHLSAVLADFTASRLSTLRTRYGLPAYKHAGDGGVPINWLVLVGQIEDTLLADLVTDRFGVSITAELITAIRTDLGISSFKSRKPKLESHIRDLVGRYTASNIAQGWGVSINAIEAYRKLSKKGLPQEVGGQKLEGSRWKNEWIELFPHQTNAQIARATGMSAMAVRAMRNTLLIAAPTSRTYWKIVSDNELDSLSDVQLSEQYGGPLADYAAQRLAKALRDKAVIRLMAKTKQLPDQLTFFLSLMPMRRLAKLTAISEFHLKRQRTALGMEPYTPLQPQFEALLSTCPDTEVAEKAHVAVSTVKFRRDKLGKPAYSSRKRKGE